MRTDRIAHPPLRGNLIRAGYSNLTNIRVEQQTARSWDFAKPSPSTRPCAGGPGAPPVRPSVLGQAGALQRASLRAPMGGAPQPKGAHALGLRRLRSKSVGDQPGAAAPRAAPSTATLPLVRSQRADQALLPALAQLARLHQRIVDLEDTAERIRGLEKTVDEQRIAVASFRSEASRLQTAVILSKECALLHGEDVALLREAKEAVREVEMKRRKRSVSFSECSGKLSGSEYKRAPSESPVITDEARCGDGEKPHATGMSMGIIYEKTKDLSDTTPTKRPRLVSFDVG